MDETQETLVEPAPEVEVTLEPESLAVTEETVSPVEESEPAALRQPRKGRDTFLADKAALEKEVSETPSLRSLAAKAGVSYNVLMNWLAYHEVAPPVLDKRAVAKFYESVKLDESTECWLWQGKATIRYQGKAMKPDRFAVQVVAQMEDLGRKRLVRTCGNPLCVNPEHLVLKVETDKPDESPSLEGPQNELVTEAPTPSSEQ